MTYLHQFLNAITTVLLIMYLGFQSPNAFAQETEKEAMAKLSFLMGNWKGQSTGFTDGKPTSSVEAYEKIQYLLDGNILTLDLDSPNLQLHTVITYNLEERTYYYHPFTKNRAGKYKGQYTDGQFMVYFDENRRLIFEKTEQGAFHEYGEKRTPNGNWVKYFEDLFYPTSAR